MKKNLTIKEEFLIRIKNVDGKVSLIKLLVFLLKIPLYIISYLAASVIGEIPNRKKRV
jgi:hypothetical protein